MSLLTGFNVTFEQCALMGYASLAAFDGKPIPDGWTVVTPADLGLGSQYQDGNYFKNGNSGASAIVLQQGNEFIIAFRGTDDSADVANYTMLANGSYLNFFTPLLNAVSAYAPVDAQFSFTGASLGGGVVNNIANVAATAYGGRFADGTFVAFASPIVVNKSGILNLGVENDPIFKLVNGYRDQASSLDNLVLATDNYLAGNYDGRHPFSMDDHNSAQLGLDAVNQLQVSEFYDIMVPDSNVIFAASDGVITDMNPKRASVGAFYIGREGSDDQMKGRNGADFLEGFGGDDTLTGGAGNDQIKGGEGNDTITGGLGNDILQGGDGDDTFVISGLDAKLDQFDGGAGYDTLQVTGTSDLIMLGFNPTSVETWQGNGKGVIGDKTANTLDFSGLQSVSGLAYVDGGAGSDVLVGSQGADDLRGNKGRDTITGGEGNDTLSGGADPDAFIFHADFGKDVITDFTEGTGLNDVIQFDQSLFADFNAVMAAAVQVGLDVEIHLDADNVLTLSNVSLTGATTLVADDFRFI
jgi:Ca2+-binding RTX toxin-like protein